MLTSRSRSPLPVPLLLALVGLAFSVWNAWDAASVPCLSAGCTLYQTFTVNGFSLWWVGAAAFGLFALLAVTGQAGAGRLVAGAGVALDCVLLCVMALTLPCFACMVAALLLALCYWAFRHAAGAPKRIGQGSRRGFSFLLLIWSLCFVMLLGVALHSSMSPWAVRGPAEDEASSVHIFFSPSCSACRQLVNGMPAAEAARVSWYPVAEDERDLPVLLALRRRLAVGDESMSAALAASRDAPALSFLDFFSPETLLMRFRLWRNQTRVIESGDGQLPFVEFRGLPLALIRPREAGGASRAGAPSRAIPSGPSAPLNPPGQTESLPDATLPIDLGDAGSCGGPDATPCP